MKIPDFLNLPHLLAPATPTDNSFLLGQPILYHRLRCTGAMLQQHLWSGNSSTLLVMLKLEFAEDSHHLLFLPLNSLKSSLAFILFRPNV